MSSTRKRSTSAAKRKKQDEPVETAASAAARLSALRASQAGGGDDSALNPRTKHLEWNGAYGAAVTVFILPVIVLLINTLCSGAATSANQCSLSWFVGGERDFGAAVKAYYAAAEAEVRAALPQVPLACGILLAWYAFHCAFYLFFPLGERGYGLPLRTGKQDVLLYHFSALWSFGVTYAVAILGHFQFGWFNWGGLADLYLALAIGSILLSAVFSLALYAASFRGTDSDGKPVLLALGGNSGHFFYDFFVGRELNPRWGLLDFKFMFELRPGLIGWTLIAWAFVIRAAETTYAAEGGYFAAGLLPLVGPALANTWYVLDGLWFESGNVSMMDIAYDGFGFMLCFGDLAWVPFLYALQCKFLYMYPAVARAIPRPYLALCAAVYVAGYCAFRFSNSAKDRFRKDPSDPRVAHLKTMKTARGTKLIISGWWGICRHPNYVGDWLMVVATSMFTGYTHVLPYFQVVYFAVLLIHRQLRDEDWMLKKYGAEDWKRYCDQVPYRLIPGVY